MEACAMIWYLNLYSLFLDVYNPNILVFLVRDFQSYDPGPSLGALFNLPATAPFLPLKSPLRLTTFNYLRPTQQYSTVQYWALS